MCWHIVGGLAGAAAGSVIGSLSGYGAWVAKYGSKICSLAIQIATAQNCTVSNYCVGTSYPTGYASHCDDLRICCPISQVNQINDYAASTFGESEVEWGTTMGTLAGALVGIGVVIIMKKLSNAHNLSSTPPLNAVAIESVTQASDLPSDGLPTPPVTESPATPLPTSNVRSATGIEAAAEFQITSVDTTKIPTVSVTSVSLFSSERSAEQAKTPVPQNTSALVL